MRDRKKLFRRQRVGLRQRCAAPVGKAELARTLGAAPCDPVGIGLRQEPTGFADPPIFPTCTPAKRS